MSGKKLPKSKRNNYLKIFILVGFFFIVGFIGFQIYQTIQQNSLDKFYNTPNPIPSGKPGTLLKYEPVSISDLKNTKAYRILYKSERANGSPTVSSGMIYIPLNSQPKPIVAWAHGTIGMGKSCAPSRTNNPSANIGGFSQMIESGWIVVATDYSGLGTEGIEEYLIGKSEAYDILNSVRAAQEFPEAHAKNEFALWGHSQGGHAVLFAATEASSYAPELQLIAVAAGAPATELVSLMNQQYNTTVGWAIGPEISVAWSHVYSNLQLPDVLSKQGIENYKRLADECILPETLESIIRNKLGEDFFAQNPTQFPSWQLALTQQTPQPLLTTPLLIVQSHADSVVLPNTTQEFVKKSCKAGSLIELKWLNSVSHMQTARVAGPSVVAWLADRFAEKITHPTCNSPLTFR